MSDAQFSVLLLALMVFLLAQTILLWRIGMHLRWMRHNYGWYFQKHTRPTSTVRRGERLQS